MEYLEESGQGDVFIQCSEMDWDWKLNSFMERLTSKYYNQELKDLASQ